MTLYKSLYSHAGPIWALSTLQLYVAFSVVEYNYVEKLQARTAHDNRTVTIGIDMVSHMKVIWTRPLNS